VCAQAKQQVWRCKERAEAQKKELAQSSECAGKHIVVHAGR
jgi:hypothetical protein